MSQRISGVLLDASVLLADRSAINDSATLRPGADFVLRNLRYSKIPVGISYGQGLSASKVSYLQQIASLYLCDYFMWNSPSVTEFMSKASLASSSVGGYIVHVVSNQTEEPELEPKDPQRLIILLRSVEEGSNIGASIIDDIAYTCIAMRENSKAIFIDKLEELPLTICCLIKKVMVMENIKTIAYVMKPSREEDFARRGAFPLCPTASGLIFMPISYEVSLSAQLEHVDALLHKVTDDIVSIEMSTTNEFIDKVTYTTGMEELQRTTLQCYPGCCIVDPFNSIYPVLDRLRIQQILLGLEDLKTDGQRRIRGPHFLKVRSFDEFNLEDKLLESRLSLPNIVKPQVACGVADAHSMAIVFKVDDYKGLNVPLPAIVQEYVDHSSCLYKFYVVGKKVFYAIKKSTPSAKTLMKFSEGLKPLLFDSLKSLPVDKEKQPIGDNKSDGHCMDLGLVTEAANWLKQTLDLTIFGFDVVIQEESGDHVIVDVNYLPSFKEVPDDVAIPAFWEALRAKLESQDTTNEQYRHI